MSLPNPLSLPQSVAKGIWGRKSLLQAQACLNGTGLAVPVQNGLPHGNMEQEERRAEGVSQRVTKHLDNAARCLPHHLHARGASSRRMNAGVSALTYDEGRKHSYGALVPRVESVKPKPLDHPSHHHRFA